METTTVISSGYYKHDRLLYGSVSQMTGEICMVRVFREQKLTHMQGFVLGGYRLRILGTYFEPGRHNERK